eukprot:6669158-Alexandrium_andersonii.AAC.1
MRAAQLRAMPAGLRQRAPIQTGAGAVQACGRGEEPRAAQLAEMPAGLRPRAPALSPIRQVWVRGAVEWADCRIAEVARWSVCPSFRTA